MADMEVLRSLLPIGCYTVVQTTRSKLKEAIQIDGNRGIGEVRLFVGLLDGTKGECLIE